jgi:myosin heavy subunit
MAKCEVNSWVWITDPEECYLPAKVLKSYTPGEETKVETEDGEEHKLDAKASALTGPCNEEALNSNIDDLISISDLNEMSILHLLRIRFKKDIIYTNISAILVSVNPFKLLPLYTPEILDKYRNGSRDLPPHVFGTAYDSYNNMLQEKADQSVVISGESGAGKSEATKLILQYLADVSGRAADAATGDVAGHPLEEQLLSANPILEAFGNAKTLRNNNSSRFGKLITVYFNTQGSIIGGGVINYLLEKSRVVQQTVGERNYHIFYQLLSTLQAHPTIAAECNLKSAELFTYLNPKGKGVTLVDGISDEQDFEDLVKSMDMLNFGQLKTDIYHIIGGTLHFGNVDFKKTEKSGNEGSEVDDMDVVKTASKLWGVPAEEVSTVLTSKLVGAREKVKVDYTTSQAIDCRDAMVKKVYAELFQQIVDKINIELKGHGVKGKDRFIGVLDIFGFESFEVNSFEQLCINFCNEKLQFHFNEHIFKMELTLYEAEGITISGSTFVDNQPTLDLLEAKGGIFSLCDEEINVPRGSDAGFLSKVLSKFAKKNEEHPNCMKPRPNQIKDDISKNFGVLHYAGPVFYNCNAFLEKNKDSLHLDVVSVLAKSTVPTINSIFKAMEERLIAESQARGKKMVTLGGQFKDQLNQLIDTLNSTYPHFVRCMKSNDKKCGGIFESPRMQDQLRYAGLVEVCRIRKLGYPIRRQFTEFYNRFKVCNLLMPNLDQQLAFLEKEGVLIKGEWAKGKTRVFMRNQQSNDLELYREKAMTKVAVLVQTRARVMIAQIRYKSWKKILASLKAAVVTRTEPALKEVLDLVSELPYYGAHLADVKTARATLARVVDENRVFKLLENALVSGDLNSLKSAVDACSSLAPPVTASDTPLFAQCVEKIKEVEEMMATKEALIAAIASKDPAQLGAAIERAQKINLSAPELQQAVALKTRIEKQDEILGALKDATAAKDLDKMNEGLSRCQEVGIEGFPEIAAAEAVKEELLEQMRKDEAMRKKLEEEKAAAEKAAAEAKAKREGKIATVSAALDTAMESQDVTQLNKAVQDAIEMGLNDPKVQSANEMLSQLAAIVEVKSKIHASLESLEVKCMSGISSSDLGPLNAAIKQGDKLMTSASFPFPELDEAKTQFDSYKQQAQVFVDLQSGCETKERVQLKDAVSAADNLGMEIDLVAKAKNILRQLELDFRAEKEAKAMAGDYEEYEEEYDEAEEARRQRQVDAAQPKYALQYFSMLRDPNDYAKGAILNKSRIKASQLVHQTSKIPKSITVLDKETNKRALEIHKNLLGYMGDIHMPFPAMLAYDVLRKGFESKELRDEIYVQIIKQVTNNPRPESVAKGWQLMCMCCGTFPPSIDLEMHLLHFIMEKRESGKGAVTDYARYCIRTVEAMLSAGGTLGYVPVVEEILAFKERPPILATISLVDGGVVVTDMPVTPDTNASKIIECICQMLNLEDPRTDMLGIFVYDLGDNSGEPQDNVPYHDLQRTPRPLRNEEFLGDVVVNKARTQRDFKFVFKKKIFLAHHNVRSEDPHYERLLFMQGEDEAIVQGNIELPDAETAAWLGSISMVVWGGKALGDTVEELVAKNVLDFIPVHWRKKMPAEKWAELVLEYKSQHMCPPDIEEESEEGVAWYNNLQYQFLETLQQSPMYGMHWFYVHPYLSETKQYPKVIRTLPYRIALAFSQEGLAIFNMSNECIVNYPFAEIFRWGGSSGLFSIILGDEKSGTQFDLSVITSQGNDIAGCILDHIRGIMDHPAN